MEMYFMRMADVPSEWRPRLRELSFGPYKGSMWRWSYHDGSTWVVVLFVNKMLVGWSCMTCQEEPYPVLGVYVDDDLRGQNYAYDLVVKLLQHCREKVTDGKVYAVNNYWPHYKALIERFGWQHLEWE